MASQMINVVDTHAPMLSALPGPTTIECPAMPSFATPTASDPCDPSPTLTFADVMTPGSCPQAYSVTRTWTATDHCGNQSTASQTITVQDTTPPVISMLPGPTTIECPATPSFATPSVSDACDPSPALTFSDTTTPGSCPQAYSVTRSWTATDHCGNNSTASQMITVVDTHAPSLSALPGPTTIECPATPSFATPTVSDACDPSPTLTFADVTTLGSCPQAYSVTRTWTATDHCANQSTASQTINMVDTTPPTLVCPANQTILTGPGPVTFTTTATDACDAAPIITFNPPSGSTFPLGTTIVSCEAKDSCGNTTVCHFNITMTSSPGFGNGSFCTLSQGAFGNRGSYGYTAVLSPNFSTLFPSGVTVGHVGNYHITFTSATAVEVYLPANGNASVLTGNLLNPTTTSARVFGGQVLTLRLNRDLSSAGITPTGFGSVMLCHLVDDAAEDTALNLTAPQAAALNGQTINQVLADAENVLGGSGALSAHGLSVSQLNALVSLLNLSFEATFTDAGGMFHPCGGISAFASVHLCP
jgi:HYR domain-containing protein